MRGGIKRGKGALGLIGFRRQTPFLSYGAQATFANHDYIQIGSFHDKAFPNATLQSFLGLSTENLGSLSLTYTNLLNNFYPEPAKAPNFYEFLLPNAEIVTLSYSKNIFKRLFFTVSYLTDMKNKESQQIYATLILPLGAGNKSVSVNEYSQGDQHQENIQLVKNLPLGNGYGYRLSAANNKNLPLIGEVQAQTNQGLIGARYLGIDGINNEELNAKGSIIGFAGRIFAARYVDQAFALVDTSPYTEVEVYSRNQLIGKTNRKGLLYVPELLPYQQNDIKIDVNKLPLSAEIDKTEYAVTPYKKSGALVRFHIENTQNVLLTLTTAEGAPVPAGASVYLDSGSDSDTDSDPDRSREAIPVGYFGQVFINKRYSPDKIDNRGNVLITGAARWGNQSCRFKLTLSLSERVLTRQSTVCR
jgi:outer membrane usher protein